MKRELIFACLALTLLLSSCAGTKDKKGFTYFNNLPEDSLYVNHYNNLSKVLLLQPGDVITIKLSTMDDISNRLFNQGVLQNNISTTTVSGMGSENTLQTDGYLLDVNGAINFPVFGLIDLKGKTIEEAQMILTQKISTQVKNPIVNVRLTNAIVTVMGEVGHPGIVNISDRRTTLLEALGRAGDIQPTGQKNDIKVIRTIGNKTEFATLNLNDIASTQSPFYVLQQGDIIVVNSTSEKQRIVRGALDSRGAATLTFGVISALNTFATLILTIRK
ncbi:MAG TPA: polysaccharide biosynthesis/export family protein [Edaphocola sp.]|nr:polysaccharide biosynthesis/export family protein [Edaphocola sp.]